MNLPTVRNIYCLGRNYAAHARELGNDVTARPLVFMKPASAIVASGGAVIIPRNGGSCHHEIELALLIGKDAQHQPVDQARDCIAAYAVALDMTLRDRQEELKKAGHPWALAKAFDSSLPLSEWVLAETIDDPNQLTLNLTLDGVVKQCGNTNQMMLTVEQCVSYISEFFPLRAGDVILTGTPPGVGPVASGQTLVAQCGEHMSLTVHVSQEL